MTEVTVAAGASAVQRAKRRRGVGEEMHTDANPAATRQCEVMFHKIRHACCRCQRTAYLQQAAAGTTPFLAAAAIRRLGSRPPLCH